MPVYLYCFPPTGGYSGVLVQDRSLSIMGTILESDNSYVGTLGRRIPVEFYAFKKFVNLVDVLIYMIKVVICHNV